jgi:predicted nucleotidyltransferase
VEQKVKSQLDAITSAIVETVPVEQIFLFGSHAYGTPHAESDLDIYVVMRDESPLREVEASRMIGEALYDKKSIPTDILVSRKARFDNRTTAPTLEQEIAEKGMLLYG